MLQKDILKVYFVAWPYSLKMCIHAYLQCKGLSQFTLFHARKVRAHTGPNFCVTTWCVHLYTCTRFTLFLLHVHSTYPLKNVFYLFDHFSVI
jgi:hypothetical protein